MGCAAPERTPPTPPDSGHLEIVTRLESDPLEGELGQVHVRIRNGTPDYLLLLDFKPEGMPSGLRWQIIRPGTVTYDVTTNTFHHDRKKSSRKQELFNLALLAPGEEISFRTRIRLLHLPKKYEVQYFRYNREQLADRIYLPEGNGRYARCEGEELEARLRPDTAASPTSHRMVIFPFAEQVNAQPLRKKTLFRENLRPRRFPLSSALEKLGLRHADQTSYFSTLGLWVVRSKKKSWLVSSSRTIELPAIRNEEPFFHYLDARDHPKIEVLFQKETKTLFAKQLPLVSDPDGKGYLAFVPQEILLPFFERVRDFGLTMDVDLGGHGSGRLVVSR